MRCDALLFLSTLGDFARTNYRVKLTFLYVCVGALLGLLSFAVPWLFSARKSGTKIRFEQYQYCAFHSVELSKHISAVVEREGGLACAAVLAGGD